MLEHPGPPLNQTINGTSVYYNGDRTYAYQ